MKLLRLRGGEGVVFKADLADWTVLSDCTIRPVGGRPGPLTPHRTAVRVSSVRFQGAHLSVGRPVAAPMIIPSAGDV